MVSHAGGNSEVHVAVDQGQRIYLNGTAADDLLRMAFAARGLPSGQQGASADPQEIAAEKRIDAVRDLVDDLSAVELLKRFQRLEADLPQPLSATSRLRIGLCKSLCHLRMGDREGAARMMLAAYEHAPNDPRAVAHKVLGHWFLGETKEASDFGQAALECDPSNDLAAFYLIQAQADLSDCSDPMVGVPAALRDNASVLLAEVMTLRRGGPSPTWWPRAKAAAALHPEDSGLAALAATAVVEEVTCDEAVHNTRVLSDAQRESLRAAEGPLDAAWRTARGRLNDAFELGVQHLSAALVCAKLLDDDDKLDTLLAVIDGDGLTDPGLIATAARVLESPRRPELFDRLTARAIEHPMVAFQVGLELVQRGDWIEGARMLERATIPPEEQPPVVVLQRLAALTTGGGTLEVADLEAIYPDAAGDPRALILISQVAREAGHDEVADRTYAEAVARAKTSNSIAYRATVAARAHNLDRPSDVIDLLDGLDAARTDERMLLMLARSHATERPRHARNLRFFQNLPQGAEAQYEISCHRAAVYFELDRPEAVELARDLTRRRPDDAFGVALLVAALRVARREAELPEILRDVDLEALTGTIDHRFAAIHAFRRAGETERALREAFAIVLAHPNDEQAVTGYLSLHWSQLFDRVGEPVFDEPASIATGCWVKLCSDHGVEVDFIIGNEAQVPGTRVYALTNELAAACIGLNTGDSFEQVQYLGLTATWTVQEFKSKYLFLWQHLLKDFNQRFPTSRTIMSIPVPENDISAVESIMSNRHQVMTDTLKAYMSGGVPLAMAARVVGSDPLTFAQGVREAGGAIRSSVGLPEEQGQAWATGRRARGRGVVLDPYTAVVAARAGALVPLRLYFGELLTTTSTVRLLDGIIAHGAAVPDDGLWQLGWKDGGLERHMTPADVARHQIELIERTRADILEHCTVEAAPVPDNAPDALVTWTMSAGPRVMDCVSLAFARSLPLLSDDMIFRAVADKAAAVPGLWLHAAMRLCCETGDLNETGFVRVAAMLARHRHRHALLMPEHMRLAFDLDADADLADFRALSWHIGGPDMDVGAHAGFIAAVYANLWDSVPRVAPIAARRALGIMLDNYTRGAGRALPWLMYMLRLCIPRSEEFWEHVTTWGRGRFLIDERGRWIDGSAAGRSRRTTAAAA